MERAIVFFSHSSEDKAPLMYLKGLVNERTSASVDIFLSSDGQSIPFGRNWVYEIEKALEHASLMFVFVTPNSVGSQWMLFEAGYAYSKKVRVVPVGFFGVDIGSIPPPLGLLQGFNVSSQAELSNIVGVLNEEVRASFPVAFSQVEYDILLRKAGLSSAGGLGRLTVAVEEVSTLLHPGGGLKDIPEKVVPDIARLLENHGIEHQVSELAVHLPGMKIYVHGQNRPIPPTEPLRVLLAPMLLQVSVPILNQVLGWVMRSKARGLNVLVSLKSSVDCISESHQISARLYGTAATPHDAKQFILDEVHFEVYKSIDDKFTEHAVVRLTLAEESVSLEKIRHVLELLFETGVLYYRK